MKHISLYFGLYFFLPLLLAGQTVVSIKVEDAINPVTAEFIHDAIERANSKKACLLIHLNTPGGLLKSTRVIVSDLLQSPVPIIVYVYPGGAHAGSAGVFITLAANVAAMAPGTNIGAAHPVNLQGGMDSIISGKTTNDAAAFIRSIAKKRNRNLEWAEEAVRNSLSITETEAKEKNVVDLIANSDRDLLNQIDGKKIELSTGIVKLNTKGANIEWYRMGKIQKFLNIISDPNIAYILMMLGFFGILFELYNPGAILPGIVGGIASVLAFYSMHTLPVNYAGLALIIFGIVLFLLEIKIISHGLLTIGGVISKLIGSMLLIRTTSTLEFVKISRSVIISSTAVTALFFLFVLGLGLKAQQLKTVTGIEGLIGQTGESLDTLDPTGRVRVQGEVWNAESVAGNIGLGKKVRIKEMRNLKLYVEQINT
jgi:membrane-bound serine protease (ClpP class)